MSFGTYRQYDSRWGSKNYNGSSNYATAACGPTSCANILYALNPKITPITTGNYMKSHGYAIYGNGTSWDGIPACLKAYGAKDVRNVSDMSDVFEYCSKGYVGVFLFTAGTRGGVTWTTSGHFVAVTGYKHSNGKHYFKTFDSGGRKHDGWYCYETTMRGLIRRVWLCKVSLEKVTKPTGKYKKPIPKPTLKEGSEGTKVEWLQSFLNWYHPAWKLEVDGNFGPMTEYAVSVFQYTEGVSHTGVYGDKSCYKALNYKYTPKADKIVESIDRLAWPEGTPKKNWKYKTGAPTKAMTAAMQKRGYDSKLEYSDCGYTVNTVVYDAHGIKIKVLAGNKDPFPDLNEKGFECVHKGGKIPSGLLKPGHIIRYKKITGSQHTMFYDGNNNIAEGGRGCRFFVIRHFAKHSKAKYHSVKVRKKTLEVWRIKE